MALPAPPEGACVRARVANVMTDALALSTSFVVVVVVVVVVHVVVDIVSSLLLQVVTVVIVVTFVFGSVKGGVRTDERHVGLITHIVCTPVDVV